MFKYSQGWIKISTRAVRVLQPLVLASCGAHLPSVPQSFYSHLRAHLCLTSPQELKWRSEIAGPGDDALATSMGLDAGAKCGRGQGKKKERSEKNSTKPTTRRTKGAQCFVYIRRENFRYLVCAPNASIDLNVLVRR